MVTTMGVKLDATIKKRLVAAAQAIDHSPHWLMKHAIIDWLEKIESGSGINQLTGFDVGIDRTGLSKDYL